MQIAPTKHFFSVLSYDLLKSMKFSYFSTILNYQILLKEKEKEKEQIKIKISVPKLSRCVYAT